MKFVEPIRSKEKVRELREYFATQNERDLLLFECGIHTGLRISDLLQLRKRTVVGTHIRLKEQKTGKIKKILIVPELKKKLKKYIENMEDDQFLFCSRQGKNKPITRVRAYAILREAAEAVGLSNIGTHTLRKTFGYHFYQEHRDVAMLQEIFNHSSEYITLRYIGVNQDAVDEAMKAMRF